MFFVFGAVNRHVFHLINISPLNLRHGVRVSVRLACLKAGLAVGQNAWRCNVPVLMCVGEQ